MAEDLLYSWFSFALTDSFRGGSRVSLYKRAFAPNVNRYGICKISALQAGKDSGGIIATMLRNSTEKNMVHLKSSCSSRSSKSTYILSAPVQPLPPRLDSGLSLLEALKGHKYTGYQFFRMASPRSDVSRSFKTSLLYRIDDSLFRSGAIACSS